MLVVRADNPALHEELCQQYGDRVRVVLDRRHPGGRVERLQADRRRPLTAAQQSMWTDFGYFAVETD